MTYPCEWMASIDKDDESGTATFMVDGTKYKLRLENFAAFRSVSIMLDATFKQGKSFAASAIKSQIEQSIEQAVRDHCQ